MLTMLALTAVGNFFDNSAPKKSELWNSSPHLMTGTARKHPSLWTRSGMTEESGRIYNDPDRSAEIGCLLPA